MSECDDKKSCDTSEKKSGDGCTVAEDMLCLAKQAKCELLKEKMKASFEAKIGKKMDRVADVVADAVIACFQHEMSGKEACNDYKEKLFSAFKS
jgi:predicted RNA-binding protein YlxR (DUF448 family)